MHFFAWKKTSKKNSLFLKKSNVRFFQKQAVFFRERPSPEKMHIYAFSGSVVFVRSQQEVC
jgi:hypothetical protein